MAAMDQQRANELVERRWTGWLVGRWNSSCRGQTATVMATTGKGKGDGGGSSGDGGALGTRGEE